MDNGNFRRRQNEERESQKSARFSLIPKPLKRFWKKYNLTRVFLLVVTIFLIFVTGYLYYLSKVANVGVLKQSLYSSTEVMDVKGQAAGSLSTQKGTTIDFKDIPKNVINAAVATEDRTFYKNGGVNYQRTILAMLTAGRFGGGSTITQQLAKNSYLTLAPTIDRKAREIFLALQITKKYSKDDILSMYLNSNGYGNGIIGIQDASRKYFGVDAKDLTLDEAATLIGLLKGPAIYNPLNSIEYATSRRNTVLLNMVDAGYIKKSEADAAMKIDMKPLLHDTYQGQTVEMAYPSYYNAVVAEAVKKYGLTADEIQRKGYKIYTGLNQDMQSGMQKAYSESWLFPQAADGTLAQSGSVALDPKTGLVNALVGNSPVENYNPYTDFNYATQAQRSPGSVIKPMIVYSPAIEAGWSIDKTVHDAPADYNGWKPQNADQTFHGDMPLYQALANSYNIPAINTYKEIGPSVGNELGRKFGLKLTEKNNILPTALGADVQTNPLQIAQAYSTFANGGLMNEAHFITKIEDASGKTVKTADVKTTKVISEATAEKMTEMMLGTYTNGTGLWADPINYTLAGKTGTNEDVDQWVVGFTPDLVMTEWLGYSDATDTSHRLGGTSAGQASQIFRQAASYVFPYTAGSKFTEKNAYAEHGIGPEYPAWTSLRQQQDNIVYNEQAKAGTSGNSDGSSASKATASSSSSSETFADKAKNLWDRFTGLFK
ncbi:MAG: PBP1A family penicillin-binding protein [Streptococcaceae bacterium]|jgi:penicillin-binding protein 2A|nr:PBP1A family penicillin-binding protein [Streptococcaceae bacterium]